VTLPENASRERTLQVLGKCERLLAGVEGVGDVLTLCGPPVAAGSNQGCVLVSLAPGAVERDQVAPAIRARLAKDIQEAVVRLGDPARPGLLTPEGYAVALAVHGPDPNRVRELARQFVDRLRPGGKLTDVGCGPGVADSPSLVVDLDREKAAALGVALDDIFQTLQVHLGSLYVNDFNRFGRTWQVTIQAPDGPRRTPEDLNLLAVRNGKGQMVPIRDIAQIRTVSCPAVVRRYNSEPMALVTANLGPGLTPAEARALCEATARDLLPAGYHLSWLQELPAAK
jgi:multidrug efflux pump subunit AcrB